MARKPACITRTLKQIDNRCIGGGAGAGKRELRDALELRFQFGELPVFQNWAAASGLLASPRALNADQIFDALYCLAWCRAYLRPASEYVAMTRHNEIQLGLLAA